MSFLQEQELIEHNIGWKAEYNGKSIYIDSVNDKLTIVSDVVDPINIDDLELERVDGIGAFGFEVYISKEQEVYGYLSDEIIVLEADEEKTGYKTQVTVTLYDSDLIKEGIYIRDIATLNAFAFYSKLIDLILNTIRDAGVEFEGYEIKLLEE